MKSFEGIIKTNIKDSKIRLTVNKLCEENFESIKKLVNLKNVEGLVVNDRYFYETLTYM